MHRYLMCLCMLCFLGDCACCVFDATGNAAFGGTGSDVGGAGSVNGGGASFDVAINACCYDVLPLLGVVVRLAAMHLVY